VVCVFADCALPSIARCLCKRHYALVSRSGNLSDYPRVRESGKTCVIEFCTELSRSKTYCPRHYREVVSVCLIDGCGKSYYRERLCSSHWRNKRLTGDPTIQAPWSPVWKTTTGPDGRLCRRCGNRKPATLDFFYISPIGAGGLRTVCIECALTRGRIDGLKSKYGIDAVQYDSMLIAQGCVCAMCGSSDPGRGLRHFSVDHDHGCCPGYKSCGKCLRGLICRMCNTALGRFEKHRENASQYLVSYYRKNGHIKVGNGTIVLSAH
jgi:hypothetical protein